MPGRTLDARKRRVFDSVFGGVGSLSQPTPVTTPATGFTAPGQAFGAPALPIPQNRFSSSLSHDRGIQGRSFGIPDQSQDQVRWDRSWHIVTHTLNLPEFKENRGVLEALRPEGGSVGPEFYDALEDVLYPQSCVPYARQTEDVVVWHTSQVRQHFLHQVLPIVLRARQLESPELVLHRSVKVLETANRQYLHGLSFIKEQIEQSLPGTSMPVVSRFLRDLHAIISNSVMEPLSECLSAVLKSHVARILGLPSITKTEVSSVIRKEGDDSERARRELLGLVESIKNVGLAGERFQVIFAEIMNDAMTEYVHKACEGVWSSQLQQGSPANGTVLPRAAHTASPSRCGTDLCEWIENRYAKLVVQTLNLLDTKANVSWADKEKYKEMGIGRLAELRTNELFEIVKNWPNATGALDDLRTAITTPQRRLHLTEVFAQTLSEKLLHPGASTLQILQMYISMIWSFHALDHSKVLLDRVAYPLQSYLHLREDTVRIIINGLLAEVRDQSGKLVPPPEGKLYELAQILTDPSQDIGQKFSDGDLDWHDMDWVPDPVDAGPGYKRSKNADIIGTMISVLGSQEVFIKEFQNIIGESMIKIEDAFNHLKKEQHVLELLKGRFGEAPLQACEVMMKDIFDSRTLDTSIRRLPELDNSRARSMEIRGREGRELIEKPAVHAKILSRLFWPELQDDEFKVPEPIQVLQRAYGEGFEGMKEKRKLTWLQALGSVTVELELEDRTVKEEVRTWQAAVIYAFHSPESGQTVQRTVVGLVAELEMDEPLLRSALKFWVHKLVLHEISPDTYTVLEKLNQEERLRSLNPSSAASSSRVGGGSEGGEERGIGAGGLGGAKEGMYWQFVQGMLKNGAGGMPLARIAAMLKTLLAEGFPFGNEELKGWLDGKVGEGVLEMKGGKYKLKK